VSSKRKLSGSLPAISTSMTRSRRIRPATLRSPSVEGIRGRVGKGDLPADPLPLRDLLEPAVEVMRVRRNEAAVQGSAGGRDRAEVPLNNERAAGPTLLSRVATFLYLECLR
jgi:hypothetical protein